MKTLVLALFASMLTVLTAPSYAAIVTTLTPDVISGGDTNTTSFSDPFVTLTPLIGATPSTFNGNATRLGIDGVGTNDNAFNDPDTDPNNGNEEKLLYEFAASAGLAQIEYDFSRADGASPEDGVFITGFTSDPAVTFSLTDELLFAVYDAGTQSVRLNIPGELFFSGLVAVNFDPSASLGQTLLMSATDTDQAGAQFAIRSISYKVIPEPATVSILASALVASLALRRR